MEPVLFSVFSVHVIIKVKHILSGSLVDITQKIIGCDRSSQYFADQTCEKTYDGIYGIAGYVSWWLILHVNRATRNII